MKIKHECHSIPLELPERVSSVTHRVRCIDCGKWWVTTQWNQSNESKPADFRNLFNIKMFRWHRKMRKQIKG